MTGAKCVSCRRPVNGAYLCLGCTDTLESTLGRIPDLAEQLALTVTRQTAMGARNGSRASDRPVFFNVEASTVAEELQVTLVGWVRDLEPNPKRQPRSDLSSVARWLIRHLDAIRQHQAADAILDEIVYAVRQAWRAVDRPANRSRVMVGRCIEVSCDGELWARVPTADYVENDPATHAAITCTVCEATYPASSWLRVGARILRETG